MDFLGYVDIISAPGILLTPSGHEYIRDQSELPGYVHIKKINAYIYIYIYHWIQRGGDPDRQSVEKKRPLDFIHRLTSALL